MSDECLVTADIALKWSFVKRPPAVVWLTDLADLTAEHARRAAEIRPGFTAAPDTLARFTLSVSDAQHWPLWARRHRIGRRNQRSMDRASGDLSGRWWVATRAIDSSEWVRVDSLLTASQIWPRPAQVRPQPRRPRPGGRHSMSAGSQLGL